MKRDKLRLILLVLAILVAIPTVSFSFSGCSSSPKNPDDPPSQQNYQYAFLTTTIAFEVLDVSPEIAGAFKESVDAVLHAYDNGGPDWDIKEIVIGLVQEYTGSPSLAALLSLVLDDIDINLDLPDFEANPEIVEILKGMRDAASLFTG